MSGRRHDSPPLAPDEPDAADAGPLLPLELLAWDDEDRLVGVRTTSGEVVLREGRPGRRRVLQVQRLTRWARAGRVSLHTTVGDLVLRLLSPEEYAGLSLGDARRARVAGPVRMARSSRLATARDDVAEVLVRRVQRVHPDVQLGTG